MSVCTLLQVVLQVDGPDAKTAVTFRSKVHSRCLHFKTTNTPSVHEADVFYNPSVETQFKSETWELVF